MRVRGSTGTCEISCRVEERLDREGLMAFGSAGMLVKFERRAFRWPARLAALPVEKASWARWTAGEELEMLLVLRALGLERIHWTETFRRDPWLAAQWVQTALPEENRVRRLTTEPIRRLFLRIPGLLLRHACGWRLHLPAWRPSAPT